MVLRGITVLLILLMVMQSVFVLPAFADAAAMAGRSADAGGPINLTEEGTLDWIHWDSVSSSGTRRKGVVEQQISTYTAIRPQGAGTVAAYTNNAVEFTYTDGINAANGSTSNGSNRARGVYISGVGAGFRLTVPADPATKTLKLWVGSWYAIGQIRATLSDGSAAAYVETYQPSGSNESAYKTVYITYAAASSNQTLTVEITNAGNLPGGGNITLQAAALVAGDPGAIPPRKFNFNSTNIEVPRDRAQWPAFREGAKEWRAERIAAMNYTGSGFNIESEWMAEMFLLTHLQLNDTNFVDPETSAYTLDKYLGEGQALFGGYDYLFLWPCYINLGFDKRNQWDYWRDQPGGLEGLRAVVADAQSQGIKVSTSYYAWDTGTRREGVDDYNMLANITKALGTDAIFLDTLSTGAQALQDILDAYKPGIVLEAEGQPSLANLNLTKASLDLNQGGRRPIQLSRNKWFERRYITHILKKNGPSDEDLTDSIHNAFFNGNGIELQENCFSAPNLIDERSSSLLRAMLPIQRRYAKMFRDNVNVDSWIPLIDTNSDDLFGSLWTNFNLRLWTLCNTSDGSISGNLITVPHLDGVKYYDLINGVELVPVISDGQATLNFGIRERGIMGIVAGKAEDLGNDFGAFLASQGEVNKGATNSTVVRPNPEILEPHDETKLYTEKTVPADMIIHARQENYPINISMAGSGQNGNGYQFRRRESDLLPYYGTPLNRTVDIPAFAIDKNGVTNAQFKEFMDATNYVPVIYDNFLKHWEKDAQGKPAKPVAGTENNPVVYVSYNDALAYSNWAGKRLPSQEEMTYAMQQTGENALAWPEAPNRVWNMTNSIRRDNQARTMILKGGTDFNQNARSVWWYGDDATETRARNYDWVTVFNMSAEGINRQESFGFRCAVDMFESSGDRFFIKARQNLITTGSYVTLDVGFSEKVESNAVHLSFAFDAAKFEYANFIPADGVTILNTQFDNSAGNVFLVLMVDDYNTQDYGGFMLRAKTDVTFENGSASVDVWADYVMIVEDGEKEIFEASASTSFTTTGKRPEPDYPGIFTLIDLSNMIDAFGADASHPDWLSTYQYLDYLNIGVIDIRNIIYVAQYITL